MAITSFLDPVFSPLLKLPILLTIILISFVISLIIILVYKKFTDQNLMKQLKEEVKELQKEMKTLKDKPQEMMKIQKKAMETNMRYMMHSLKPTLITFIPIIIIFGWLNAHMAYDPLLENQQFSATLVFLPDVEGKVEIIPPEDIEVLSEKEQDILEHQVKYTMKGKKGEYTLKFKIGEEEYSKEIIVTDDKKDRFYTPPTQYFKEGKLKQILVSNKKVKAFEGIPLLESIPWVGGFGWLGAYILFSLIFSLSLRKFMKVY